METYKNNKLKYFVKSNKMWYKKIVKLECILSEYNITNKPIWIWTNTHTTKSRKFHIFHEYFIFIHSRCSFFYAIFIAIFA